MREADRRRRTYSVAWIDTLATRPAARPVGAHPRRARDARRADRPRRAATRWPLPGDPRLAAPPVAARRAGRPGRRCARSTSCGSARRRGTGAASSSRSPTFFHPLDGVAGWNRLYGPRGFVQYQFVVPDGAEDDRAADRRAHRPGRARRRSSPCSSGSARATPGLLSFPIAGLDAGPGPAGPPGPAPPARRARPSWSSARGGRVYLAKDSRLDAGAAARRCTPASTTSARSAAGSTPTGVFQSDLSRRLRSCDPT